MTATDIDAELTRAANRLAKAKADRLPTLAQLLRLDVDQLLDAKLAHPANGATPRKHPTPGNAHP